MSAILILGEHPIKSNISIQFKKLGMEIIDNPPSLAGVVKDDIEEIVLLSSPVAVDRLAEDSKAIARLRMLEKSLSKKTDPSKIMTVHLMLQSRASLQMLQNNNLVDDICKSFDVCPFTLEDEWAKKVCREIAITKTPIDIKSDVCQHLVVFGTSEAAEAMMVNAALTFHYPNYTRNHKLRSRITVVSPETGRWLPLFLQRHEHLFRHSFYRVVDTAATPMALSLHKPENLSNQEDYVDIEWEFVVAGNNDDAVREKLSYWASSRLTKNLSMVFATEDDERNMSMALQLPDIVYDNGVPVYVRVHDDSLFRSLDMNSRYKPLHVYGMDTEGYDVTLPLVRMGRIVNDIYCQCYNDNYMGDNVCRTSLFNAVDVKSEAVLDEWRNQSSAKRCSNIFNAMTVPVKLQSVGISMDEWDKCYDLTETDINILSEVEHNRWNVEELILGFRPCTKAEQEAVELDISQKEVLKERHIHYDIRAYKDLRADSTGRNANVYDIVLTRCLPLIASEYFKTASKKEGGNG